MNLMIFKHPWVAALPLQVSEPWRPTHHLHKQPKIHCSTRAPHHTVQLLLPQMKFKELACMPYLLPGQGLPRVLALDALLVLVTKLMDPAEGSPNVVQRVTPSIAGSHQGRELLKCHVSFELISLRRLLPALAARDSEHASSIVSLFAAKTQSKKGRAQLVTFNCTRAITVKDLEHIFDLFLLLRRKFVCAFICSDGQ